MRRMIVASLAAGCLLVEGAGAASASTPTMPQVATVRQAAAPANAQLGTGVRPAGANQLGAAAPVVKQAAAHPERRTRNRSHRKRSFLSRLFGTILFLFIGLPLLIILGLVIFFMMRRARKQREQGMYNQGTMNPPTNGQQWSNGPGNTYGNDGRGPGSGI